MGKKRNFGSEIKGNCGRQGLHDARLSERKRLTREGLKADGNGNCLTKEAILTEFVFKFATRKRFAKVAFLSIPRIRLIKFSELFLQRKRPHDVENTEDVAMF